MSNLSGNRQSIPIQFNASSSPSSQQQVFMQQANAGSRSHFNQSQLNSFAFGSPPIPGTTNGADFSYQNQQMKLQKNQGESNYTASATNRTLPQNYLLQFQQEQARLEQQRILQHATKEQVPGAYSESRKETPAYNAHSVINQQVLSSNGIAPSIVRTYAPKNHVLCKARSCNTPAQESSVWCSEHLICKKNSCSQKVDPSSTLQYCPEHLNTCKRTLSCLEPKLPGSCFCRNHTSTSSPTSKRRKTEQIQEDSQSAIEEKSMSQDSLFEQQSQLIGESTSIRMNTQFSLRC
jgi:hypothetical protein